MFDTKLLSATTAALIAGSALILSAPPAQADTEQTFWGVGSTLDEAASAAESDMSEYEAKTSQTCSEMRSSSYDTPAKPSTRLSGSWQYWITANCEPTSKA